jgi:hypothetical protein
MHILCGAPLATVIVALCCFGGTHYIDSQNGADGNNGLSTATAWKSLSKVNSATLGPGDTILFKCGCAWSGQLTCRWSGSSGKPIVIGKYGIGYNPIINATNGGVVIQNQQYIEVSDLEVTGSGDGIDIRLQNFGAGHHFYIRNCTIHDNSGKGIFVNWNVDNTGKTRYDDLLIEGNHIYKTQGIGIHFWYDGDWYGSDHPCTQVRVRNNALENIGADGIIVSGSMLKPLIEYNVLNGFSLNAIGQNRCQAGIWGAGMDSSLWQYNESCNGQPAAPDCDRNGFDSDLGQTAAVFQYNYSHDNAGGFMLIMHNSTNMDIRYNISQNDGIKMFHFNGDVTGNKRIYNNVFYIKSGLGTRMIDNDDAGSTPPIFYNNIVYNLGTQQAPLWGQNNCYFGNLATTTPGKNIIADPQFVNAGSGGEGMNSVNGYQLTNASPCLNAGTRVSGVDIGNRDYFGYALPASGPIDIGAYQHGTTFALPPGLGLKPAPEVFPVRIIRLPGRVMVTVSQTGPYTLTICSAKGSLLGRFNGNGSQQYCFSRDAFSGELCFVTFRSKETSLTRKVLIL